MRKSFIGKNKCKFNKLFSSLTQQPTKLSNEIKYYSVNTKKYSSEKIIVFKLTPKHVFRSF